MIKLLYIVCEFVFMIMLMFMLMFSCENMYTLLTLAFILKYKHTYHSHDNHIENVGQQKYFPNVLKRCIAK